jgi:contractile injection system tape measure protein
MNATHRVRHLEWRARRGSAVDAFAVRSQLRRFVETDLLPTLERAFDAMAGGDTIHLSRLELAVHVGSLDQLGAAIADAIEQHARTWKRERETIAGDGAIGARSLRELDAVTGAGGLVRYLETGLLPWPLANLGREPTLAKLVDIARGQSVAILAAAPESIDESTPFLFRWLQVVPEDEWIEIARRIESTWPDRVPGVADAIERALRSSIRSRRLEIVAATLAVAIARGHGHAIDAEAVGVRFESLARGSSPCGPIVEWIDRTMATTNAADRQRQIYPATAFNQHETLTGPADLNGQALGKSAVSTDATGASVADGSHAVSVDHAGLVLIHPFLPRLFERTEITRPGDRAIAPERLPRAAALLAFAARGDDDPRDFELPFIKVLLGRRLDDPMLVPGESLSDRDRGEVDDLLRSVIEHWRVLKHTSIAGLRASFLQRRGSFVDVDETWRLRVEADAFDVLLQHLPWTLSITTLPWMTRPIFIEWATL